MANDVSTKGKRAMGVVFIMAGLYLGISLISHSEWDPSLLTYTPDAAGNWGGIAGAYISDGIMALIGLSAYALPVFLIVYGIKGLFLFERHKINLLGSALFMLSFSALSALMAESFGLGISKGIIGAALGSGLKSLLSIAGAYIITLPLVLASIILLSPEAFINSIFSLRGKRAVKEEAPEGPPLEEETAYEDASDVFIMPPPLEEEVLLYGDGLPDEAAPEAAVKGGGYKLPSIEMLLLHEAPAGQRPSKGDTLSDTSMIERKLGDFGVVGKVTQVHIGPVVTMYELEPAPGLKINKVESLSDDLALALKARCVRIAPIPGKAAIGIEVPNRYREAVSLREIVSSDGFRKSPSKLTLALGKDIFGNPIVTDLAKMPHLLVAGATGSGKSVSINSMVVSLIYKATPDEVKLVLIDPKLLELSAYEGIPHLISPVITGPKEAAEALRKIVFEMDRRYRVIAEKGARNIEGYNSQLSAGEERLPYIVVFIDELADLMFTSASVVEDSIARLTQMARASGIHLIVATQRPSVDVITGIIKANFPARISFQVTTRVDSRTILDTQGAEQLIGNGDMLFMLPGARLMRIHGSLVTEPEIRDVTGFIKAQGAPDYGIFESIHVAEPEKDTEGMERDELYYKAVEHASSVGEVSISSIQRRLKIGYNRAARIMELMEEDGLVGPPKAAGKPRDFIGRRGSATPIIRGTVPPHKKEGM